MATPTLQNEDVRVQALRALEILDTPAEREFEDIAFVAAQVCDTPIAGVVFLDSDRQWFKSIVGFHIRETPRTGTFLEQAIASGEGLFEVADADLDPRFARDPFLLSDFYIRFFAGAPIVTKDGHGVGAVCVYDTIAKELNSGQRVALQALARQVALRLELRRATRLLEKANEELKDLSMKDELTGLHNLRGFMLHAERHIRRFRAGRAQKNLWLLVGDMDGLKQINDTFGHQAGSQALMNCADVLAATLRETDVIARPGGDEFTALLIDISDDMAKKIPERLEAAFAEFNRESGLPFAIEMSVGLAKAERDGDSDVTDILKRADKAMYEHKRERSRRAA